MWSSYIMNLLLLLAAYGTEIDPSSDAAAFDYNGNGYIDSYDLLVQLNNQPRIKN